MSALLSTDAQIVYCPQCVVGETIANESRVEVPRIDKDPIPVVGGVVVADRDVTPCIVPKFDSVTTTVG